MSVFESFKAVCPKCRQGHLFASRWSLQTVKRCPVCGLDLSKEDSADGPAVFLIFILGFTIVPLAVVLEVFVAPPLWVHAALWGAVLMGLSLGALRPIKAYVLYLQYKHRRSDWR